MIIKEIKRGIGILASPKQEFNKLNKRTLEEAVADYMKLLLAVAIASGLFNLIYALIRAVYLDALVNIDIEYWTMLNYAVGRSISLIFLYLFTGTFLLFFFSLIIKPFTKKLKYTSLLKILFYSLTPFLLFSWFLPNPTPLTIWSVFLLITGVKNYGEVKIKANSIYKRE